MHMHMLYMYVCAYAYMHVPKARRRRVSLTLTRRHAQEDGLRVGRPGAVDIGDRGSCAQAELQLGVVSSVRQSEEECPHAAAARDGSGTAEARAVARRV